MKLKLFLIAASAMALASCSSDDVVKSNEDANVIKFSVVANNASRAADYYCNESKPKDFVVSASVGGEMYFDQEIFKTTDDGASYQIFGDLRYWPAAEITFVAAKNCDGDAFTFNAKTGSTFTMTVDGKASAQKDFIFGVTKATRGQAGKNYTDGRANINFRHALSQIVFQAKNTNENLFVEINQIKVCNLANSATYTISATSGDYEVTDDKAVDCTQSTYQDGGRGEWSGWSGAAIFDTEVFTSATIDGKVKGDGKVVNLTNDRFVTTESPNPDHVANASHKHSLLLLPQAITAWGATGQVMDGENIKSGVTGAFFLVYCRIRNVAAGNGTAATDKDVYLWGQKETKEGETVTDSGYRAIAVPVNSITWLQGKKYIYTLNFTANGHGGYDPGSGDEVLIPIEFTVSVDDFAEVTPGQEVTIDPAN